MILTQFVELMNGVQNVDPCQLPYPENLREKYHKGSALVESLVQEYRPGYELNDPEGNGEGDLEDTLALFFGTKVGPEETNGYNSDAFVGGDSRQ